MERPQFIERGAKPIIIDTSKIPPIEMRLFAASIMDVLEKHFADPENQRRFKIWQEERRKANEQQASARK